MSRFRFSNCKIKGFSTYVGENKICFKDEPYFVQKPEYYTKLQNIIGLKERYKANKNTTTCDLCKSASDDLLNALNVDKNTINAIISVTETPDYTMPGNAHILHNLLNLNKDTIALDIELGCSGFIYGLWLACMMIQSGSNKILLVAGDTLSKVINPKDKASAPLFGDAGCAALIEKSDDVSDTYFVLHSDGSGVEKMYKKGGGGPDTLHVKKHEMKSKMQTAI